MITNPFSSLKWAAIAAGVIAIIGFVLRVLSGVKKAQRNEIALDAFRKEQENVRKSRKAAEKVRRAIRDVPDDDLDDRLRKAGLA